MKRLKDRVLLFIYGQLKEMIYWINFISIKELFIGIWKI